MVSKSQHGTDEIKDRLKKINERNLFDRNEGNSKFDTRNPRTPDIVDVELVFPRTYVNVINYFIPKTNIILLTMSTISEHGRNPKTLIDHILKRTIFHGFVVEAA